MHAGRPVRPPHRSGRMPGRPVHRRVVGDPVPEDAGRVERHRGEGAVRVRVRPDEGELGFDPEAQGGVGGGFDRGDVASRLGDDVGDRGVLDRDADTSRSSCSREAQRPGATGRDTLVECDAGTAYNGEIALAETGPGRATVPSTSRATRPNTPRRARTRGDRNERRRRRRGRSSGRCRLGCGGFAEPMVRGDLHPPSLISSEVSGNETDRYIAAETLRGSRCRGRDPGRRWRPLMPSPCCPRTNRPRVTRIVRSPRLWRSLPQIANGPVCSCPASAAMESDIGRFRTEIIVNPAAMNPAAAAWRESEATPT